MGVVTPGIYSQDAKRQQSNEFIEDSTVTEIESLGVDEKKLLRKV